MLLRIVVFAVAVMLARGLVAQEDPPIWNLGASEVTLDENRLVYAMCETFAGEDLNDDDDTCGFRGMPDTDSGRSRTPIPREVGHRFRTKSDCHSGEVGQS